MSFGGSLGVDFLKESLFKPVFPDLWAVRHRLQALGNLVQLHPPPIGVRTRKLARPPQPGANQAIEQLRRDFR